MLQTLPGSVQGAQPRLTRWEGKPRLFTWLLSVISLILMAAAIYASSLITERQSVLSGVSRYNVTWATSQAALEVARLEDVLEDFQVAGPGADSTQVQIRFDIVANRVQVLGNGEPGDLIRSRPDLMRTYNQFRDVVARAEPLIDRIDQPGVARQLHDMFTPLNIPLSTLAGVAHDEGGNLVAQDLKQLSNLHWAFSGVLIALILCCFGLIAITRLHNRLLQRANAEVSELVIDLRRTGRELEVANEETRRAVEEVQQQNRILKERDRRLDLQNARFDAALNNMSQGLCMVGPDQRLIVCNTQFLNLFAISREAAATGTPAPVLFADIAQGGALPSGLIDRIWATQERLAATQRQGSFVMEDEGGRSLSVSHQPMPDGGWVATYEDITETRMAERQLAQALKMEAIGNLTGGMAHDFNNLLAVISLNLEVLIARTADDPRVHEPASRALQASLRGADLISQLLAFARRQPLAPQRISVNVWVRSIAMLLERSLGERVDTHLDLGEDIWPVNADATRLETAIANLATNARDAMPQGGRLTITTRNMVLTPEQAAERADVRPGDYVMIEVSDTGIGMRPEVMNRIFEPFFTTKDEGQGTGLGLSMVFGFIRQSGGHITVDSTPGQGTTFRLYLPRATDGGPLTEQESRIEPGRAVGGTETVLLVEDNAPVRTITADLLAELGYDVIETDNPRDAMAILRGQTEVDLLFSDVVMPGGMDGFALVRDAVQERPGLRVLLASGFAELVAGPDSAAPGVRVLAKPYRQTELARAIRETLDA